MSTLDVDIRAALGISNGYILPWELMGGCQLVNQGYRDTLSCPVREAVWQCEVIGPHVNHRWSKHLIAHERFGNGHPCEVVGVPTGGDQEALFKAAMDRLYPWSRDRRLGQPLGHAFEGDQWCTGWIETRRGGGSAGTIVMRVQCGYPREAHGA